MKSRFFLVCNVSCEQQLIKFAVPVSRHKHLLPHFIFCISLARSPDGKNSNFFYPKMLTKPCQISFYRSCWVNFPLSIACPLTFFFGLNLPQKLKNIFISGADSGQNKRLGGKLYLGGEINPTTTVKRTRFCSSNRV